MPDANRNLWPPYLDTAIVIFLILVIVGIFVHALTA